MITGTDIAVWTISAVLAIGIGSSRYSRKKSRDKMVRDLMAMDPERRVKFLNSLDAATAQEAREQLLKRYRILS